MHVEFLSVKFSEQRLTYKILSIAAFTVAIFFACKVIYAGFVALPYPQELQEASNVALTNMFIDGKTPYSVASLQYDTPGINYDYPFFGSLVAAAIAAIFGCSAVVAHFVISVISILGSGLIGFAVVKRYSRTMVAPFLAAFLFMVCHWRYGYVSAAPDDFGLFLFMLTLYGAAEPKLKHKPLWCAIGITLCFYTKQYFVFVSLPVFIYMLLYSRKEAVKLFVITLGINLAIAAVITLEWPLYWMRAFAFTYIGAGMGGGFKFSTFIDQLNYLIYSFAGLFAIVVVAIFMAARKRRLSRINNESEEGKDSSKIRRRINVSENDAFALSVVTSIVMIAPLSIIGRNDGALMSYYLQLWIHSVAVVALVLMERMKPEDDPANRSRDYVFFAAYVVVATITVYFGFGRLPHHILNEEERANWKKAYELTEYYSGYGDVFYSRSLAYDGFARGNGEWMCGHEGEVDPDAVSNIENAGVPIEFFPYTEPLVDQNMKYRSSLVTKAENHGYSLITFETGDAFTEFNEDVCKRCGYTCIEKLDLRLGNMPYEVQFYTVNQN